MGALEALAQGVERAGADVSVDDPEGGEGEQCRGTLTLRRAVALVHALRFRDHVDDAVAMPRRRGAA
jgi:hypothetical protein